MKNVITRIRHEAENEKLKEIKPEKLRQSVRSKMDEIREDFKKWDEWWEETRTDGLYYTAAEILHAGDEAVSEAEDRLYKLLTA